MRELKTSDYQHIILDAMTMEKVKKDGSHREAKPLSRSGKENIKKLCSQLCQQAMKDDIIDKNYALLVTMPEDDSVDKDVFSQHQIETLLKNQSDKTVQIILILIYTGLRINELFSIERENVHLKEKYMIGGLKTEAGINRFVPIADKVFPFVQELYAESAGNQYLVLNSRGNKMDANHFRDRNFYPTLERLGLIEQAKRDKTGHLVPRTITPHSTRHTFWNLSRNSGADKDLLTLIMGHEKYEESLDMYGHLTDIDKLKMKRIVNAI